MLIQKEISEIVSLHPRDTRTLNNIIKKKTRKQIFFL